MVSDPYIEATATLRAPADDARIAQWLSPHGLRSQPMRVGLLIQGDRRSYEAAFGIDLRHARLPLSLPIPPELRDNVTAITIPAPRRYR